MWFHFALSYSQRYMSVKEEEREKKKKRGRLRYSSFGVWMQGASCIVVQRIVGPNCFFFFLPNNMLPLPCRIVFCASSVQVRTPVVKKKKKKKAQARRPP